MQVTVTIDRKDLGAKSLDRWTKAKMKRLANRAVNYIKVRTFERGEGLDDQRLATHEELTGKDDGFGAYSKQWGMVRAGLRDKPTKYGGGRSGKGRNTGYVDLTFSGQLKRQFRVIDSLTGRFIARIGVEGSASEYAIHTHEMRPWMGLSEKDRAVIISDFREIMVL